MKTTELISELNLQNMKTTELINELNLQRREGVERIIGVKGWITALKSGLEAAKAALAQLQCIKEIAEKEDPSSKKVESRLNDDASLMFPETWITLYAEDRLAPLLDETTSIGSEEDSFKNEELLVSIEFTTIFNELVQIARELGKTVACRLGNAISTDIITKEEGHSMDLKQNEQQLSEKFLKLEQENHQLTMQLNNQMKQMKAQEQQSWKAKQNRLIIVNKNLREQYEMSIQSETKLQNEKKLLEERTAVLQKEKIDLQKGIEDLEKNPPYGNPIPDSPLQKLINKLPTTMKQIVAPDGKVTADELGTLMGSFVSSTAYIVTSANSEIQYTALSGFAAVIAQIIGAMFNNVVKHITTVEHPEWESTIVKSLTSVPWIFLGGLLPIAVGGFIPHWGVRAIVTGLVTFFMKVVFAKLWTQNYGIPKTRRFWLVVMGMFGIALAAGAPQLLKRLAKF